MAILKEWECPECGLVFRGQYPPEECPGCGEPFADLTVYDLTDEDDWLEDDDDEVEDVDDGAIAEILDGDVLDAEFLSDTERALADQLLAEDADPDPEGDDALDTLAADLGL